MHDSYTEDSVCPQRLKTLRFLIFIHTSCGDINVVDDFQGSSKIPPVEEEDNFFDLLSRFQSKRMDDQRCTLGGPENKENIKRAKIPSNTKLVSNIVPSNAIPNNSK